MTDPLAAHEEYVPGGRAIWRSERAKTYQCPTCSLWVFTQYEGDESASAIVCHGVTGHLVRWAPPGVSDQPDRE